MIIRRTIVKTYQQHISQQFAQTSQSNQSAFDDVLTQKIQKYGKHLGQIITHVQSLPFRAHFQLKKYLHAHSWCCLHMWLLYNRSRSVYNAIYQLPQSMIMRSQLKSQLEAFNYNQMQQFTDRKDREIYFQLKRISNAVFFSFDDYFYYDFKQKPIEQIICEDMGLYLTEKLTEDEEMNVERVKDYIIAKMNQLKQTPLSVIRQGKFKWSI